MELMKLEDYLLSVIFLLISASQVRVFTNAIVAVIPIEISYM